MDATYVANNQFTVTGDETSFFTATRVVRADLNASGVVLVTVQSSSYAAGPDLTTVTIDETTLTSALRRVTSTDTIRKQIIAALDTKLQKILIANGYQTDIGANTFKAKTRFDKGDLNGITIFPGFEVSEKIHGAQYNTMSVTVVGVSVLEDSDNSSDETEVMLGDLIFNLFNYNDDPTYDELASSTSYVAAGIDEYPVDDVGQLIHAQVELEIKYAVLIGDPYTSAKDNT